jgi:small conductance mechanosensitive channel
MPLLFAALLAVLAAGTTLAPAQPAGPPPESASFSPVRPTVQDAPPGAPDPEAPADTLAPEGPTPEALPGRVAEVEELLAIYRRMPGLRDIRLRLDGRVLELEGRALSMEDRERALEHARAIVDGVVYVDDRGLVVETDVRRRLEPALDRLQEKGVAFLRFLPTLMIGFAILVGGVLLATWVGRRDRLFGRIARNVFARNLARQVARAIIVLTALLLALDLMGVTALVGAVLGAAGVAGIAVGFAFRDIVENYLAGVLLSLRQPFAPNDHVRMEGEEGRVVRLTGRETVLMTLEGNHVRIPNAAVYKAVITNLTRNPRRQFQFGVGIAPREDLGRAIRVARETVAGVPGVLENPAPAARVHELQDSGVALRVTGWVNQTDTDFAKARSQAIRAVKEAFEDAGIDTPPPEYGIRILEGTPDTPEPGPERERAGGRASGEATGLATGSDAGEAGGEVDVAPDTTIEEEIARELRTSDEENLLEAPPPGSPQVPPEPPPRPPPRPPDGPGTSGGPPAAGG